MAQLQMKLFLRGRVVDSSVHQSLFSRGRVGGGRFLGSSVHQCSRSYGKSGIDEGKGTLKKNPIISEFIDRKWGGKGEGGKKANSQNWQAWPTDRPLDSVVEPTDELQPHWESLERRVLGRKPRKDGPSGRMNIRKSEEDYWLESGAYDEVNLQSDSASRPSASVGGEEPHYIQHTKNDVSDESNINHASDTKSQHFIRRSLIQVRGGKLQEAMDMVEVYRDNVLPILQSVPGFKRSSFMFDQEKGEVHATTIWDSEKVYHNTMKDLAENNLSYVQGMRLVSNHFVSGTMPEPKDFVQLAEF